MAHNMVVVVQILVKTIPKRFSQRNSWAFLGSTVAPFKGINQPLCVYVYVYVYVCAFVCVCVLTACLLRLQDNTTVLFVRRVHYKAHPRHTGKLEVRIANEDAILEALQAWAAAEPGMLWPLPTLRRCVCSAGHVSMYPEQWRFLLNF